MRDQQVVTQLDEVRGLECVDNFVKTVCEQRLQVRVSNVRITYDGARGITERNVCIEAVLLERTMTLLNCHHDLDIDDKRQFRMHQIQRAEVLPGTR